MTKAEYAKLLCDTSAAGGFPAVIQSGDAIRCAYETPEGRCCAIGIALPKGHRVRVENPFRPAQDMWEEIAEHLPPDLTPEDAGAIQQTHDHMSRKWDHDVFCQTVCSILHVPRPA